MDGHVAYAAQCAAQRQIGGGHLSELHVDLAERLVDAGQLKRICVGDVRGGREGTAVGLGGLGVGVACPGPLRGQPRVPPGGVEAVAVEAVHRQQLGVPVRLVTGGALDRQLRSGRAARPGVGTAGPRR